MNRLPLNKLLYSPEELTEPGIVVVNPNNYTQVTGEATLPPMNFAADPKDWIDMNVRKNPGGYPRRITYANVLALNDLGAVIFEKVANLGPPENEHEELAFAFYRDFKVETIPVTESIQLLKDEVMVPNIAQANEVIPTEWSLRPKVPVPFTPLVAGEAWFPDPSGINRHKYAIVNIELWRKFSTADDNITPPAPTGITKAYLDERFDRLEKLLSTK